MRTKAFRTALIALVLLSASGMLVAAAGTVTTVFKAKQNIPLHQFTEKSHLVVPGSLAQKLLEGEKIDVASCIAADCPAIEGLAMSVVSVVGVPIAFVGSGERLEDLEPFHPDRVVSRVLGMGDVLSLIERAEQAITQEDAAKLEQKIRSNEFTLDDFRDQLRTIRKMGPLEQILGMLPGMGNLKAMAENKPDEKQLGRIEAIISSMTPEERRKQHIINGSRRKRIAKGSGTSVEEVNRLLKQFVQMQKMLKSLGGMAGLAGGGTMSRRQAMQMLRNRR